MFQTPTWLEPALTFPPQNIHVMCYLGKNTTTSRMFFCSEYCISSVHKKTIMCNIVFMTSDSIHKNLQTICIHIFCAAKSLKVWLWSWQLNNLILLSYIFNSLWPTPVWESPHKSTNKFIHRHKEPETCIQVKTLLYKMKLTDDNGPDGEKKGRTIISFKTF